MLALLLAAAQLDDPVAVLPPDCSYDLKSMLTLDRNAFDQDLTGGWRPLGMTEGCELAAAELIRAWRHEKRDHAQILYWHEGQLRAEAGHTAEAAALFALTYKSADEDANFGWNHYVDGSIAFLRRDKARLQAAIKRLSALPKPEGTPDSMTMANGAVVTLNWPPNLGVLQAMERCWDRRYEAAYGEPECRTPAD